MKGKKMAQLQDLFQTHAVVKILDFLTLYEPFEYTKTDIVNETGISRRTLYQVWPILERFDLVKVTKSSGMIKFYRLNTENSISRQLVKLADKISLFEAERIARADSTPISEAYLSTLIPSSQDQQRVRITRKYIMVEETAEGPTSQVEELFRMVNLANGEAKIPVVDSTDLESVETKKEKKPFFLRLQKRMEDSETG